MTLIFAQRINRVLFLFRNTYFNIENLFTNAKMTCLNPINTQTKSQMESLKTLRLIGLVKCFTILLQIYNEAKFLHENNLNVLQNTNTATTTIMTVKTPTNVSNLTSCCLLCLDRINEPTSAMCGHIFCYSCIQAYVKSNRKEITKCPSCRNNIDQNKLIYLHNF